MIAYRPGATLSTRVARLARQGLSAAEIAARLRVSWQVVAAVLPSDCRPTPARDVPVGKTWAFHEHRTMAEVPQPAVDPRQIARAAELAAIEAFVSRHGVTRSVDFGLDQPAVDALREAGFPVMRSADRRQGGYAWLVGGGKKTTADLWAAANRELAARRQPAIKRRAKHA